MPKRSVNTIKPAGYSGAPLIDKLGIKANTRVRFINAPPHYSQLVGALPANVIISKVSRSPLDFIHLFVTSEAQLNGHLPKLKASLAMNGALWISWPKGGSAMATDLKENVVREAGLAAGLVDVKICAVDDDWSGLKFMYRLKDRAGRIGVES